jgi:tRNA(Phe) wybutosine-synthesizing methylase Tyw3
VPSTTSEIRFLPPNEERYGDIVSELADVLIMNSQIKKMFNITDEQLQKEKEFKLKRLEERIQNDNKTM